MVCYQRMVWCSQQSDCSRFIQHPTALQMTTNFFTRIGSIPEPKSKLTFMLHRDKDSLLADRRLWLAIGLLGSLLSFILINYPGQIMSYIASRPGTPLKIGILLYCKVVFLVSERLLHRTKHTQSTLSKNVYKRLNM